MAYHLVTAAAAEPLELDQAKQQCRIDLAVEDDNEYLDTLITAVRDRAEAATRRQLITATWELNLDEFPCDADWIEVPKPPLLTVPFLKYYDANGTQQTWAASNYIVDAPAGPRCRRGRVALAYGVTWPSTQTRINAVTIRFTCGYGTTGDSVPALLKQAMLIDIGTLYAYREDVIAGTMAKIPRTAGDIYKSFKSWPTQMVAA